MGTEFCPIQRLEIYSIVRDVSQVNRIIFDYLKNVTLTNYFLSAFYILSVMEEN